MDHTVVSAVTGARSAVTGEDEKSILAGKINLLVSHLPTAIGASLLSYILMAYWLFVISRAPVLLSISFCMALLSVVSIGSLNEFRSTQTTAKNAQTRSVILTVFATSYGLLWGGLGYLAIDNVGAANIPVIMLVFAGLTAFAAVILAPLQLAFYCFVGPVLTLVAIKVLLLGSDGYKLLGIGVILYMCVSILFSRGIREGVCKGIVLRVENLKLIENLTREKQSAELARTAADRSNQAKSKFIAAASHDLRQPLQALRLLTATLEANIHQPDQKHIVTSINNSVGSLEGLFNSLLDISKLDAGTVRIEIEHFDLQKLISRINHDCRALAQNKGLSFESEDIDFAVATDSILLERVIRNLTNNAIRYTASGSVVMRFTSDQNRVYLTIEDTGCGIHSADIARVFEEFVQINNPERDRSSGLGLGLSIVKRICQMLQITLNMDSVPDRGTRVTIGLPRGDVSKVALQTIKPLQVEHSLEQLFVVIVEDEEDVRNALAGLLSAWGCQVVSAGCADTAIQELEQYEYNPDVVIADYRLRDNLTGAAAVSVIEKYCESVIPAVIITGDVGIDRLQEIDSHGYPVLHKPCEPSMLAALLMGMARKTANSE